MRHLEALLDQLREEERKRTEALSRYSTRLFYEPMYGVQCCRGCGHTLPLCSCPLLIDGEL